MTLRVIPILNPAEVQVVQVVGGIDNCSSTCRAAVIVDKQITHYREHPSLEVGIGRIFVLIVKCLKGSVLQQVIGIVPVGSQFMRETEKIALQFGKIVLKCISSHID